MRVDRGKIREMCLSVGKDLAKDASGLGYMRRAGTR